MKLRYDSAWNDRILDVVADIIARFIVGGGAALVFVALIVEDFVLWMLHDPTLICIPIGVGVYYAIFGIRKGPGVI